MCYILCLSIHPRHSVHGGEDELQLVSPMSHIATHHRSWKTGPMDDELGVSKLGKISTSMNLKPGEKVQPVLLISIFFSTKTIPNRKRHHRDFLWGHVPPSPRKIWTSKFLELWVSRASISPNKQYHQKPPTPNRNVNFHLDVNSFRRFSGEDLQIEITNQGTELFSSFPKKVVWGGRFFILVPYPLFLGDEMFGLNTNRSTEKNKLSKQSRVASYSSSNLRYHSLCKYKWDENSERKSPCWPNKNRDDFLLNWFKHLYGDIWWGYFFDRKPNHCKHDMCQQGHNF